MNLGLSLMFTAGSMAGVSTAFRRLTGMARGADREFKILGQTVSQWKQDIHSALIMNAGSIISFMTSGPDYNKLTTDIENLRVQASGMVSKMTAGTKLSRAEVRKWQGEVASAAIALNRPIEELGATMKGLVHSHVDLKEIGLDSFQQLHKIVDVAGLDPEKFLGAISEWKAVLKPAEGQLKTFLDEMTEIGIQGNLGAEALNYLVEGWNLLSPAMQKTMGQEGFDSLTKMAKGAQMLGAALLEANGGTVQENLTAAWDLAGALSQARFENTQTFAALNGGEFSQFWESMAKDMNSVDEAYQRLNEDPLTFIKNMREGMKLTNGIFDQRLMDTLGKIHPKLAELIDPAKEVSEVFKHFGNPGDAIAGAAGKFAEIEEPFSTMRNLTERVQLAVSLLNDSFRSLTRDRNTEIVDQRLTPAFAGLAKMIKEQHGKGGLIGALLGKAADVDMMGSFLGLLPLGTEMVKKAYVSLNLLSWIFGKLIALIGPASAMLFTFGSALSGVFLGSWLATAMTLDFGAVLGLEVLGEMKESSYDNLRGYTKNLGEWTKSTLSWLNDWVKKISAWFRGEHSKELENGVGAAAEKGMERFKKILSDFDGVKDAVAELGGNLYQAFVDGWPVYVDRLNNWWAANKMMAEAFRDSMLGPLKTVVGEMWDFFLPALQDMGAAAAANAQIWAWERTGTAPWINSDGSINMEGRTAWMQKKYEAWGGRGDLFQMRDQKAAKATEEAELMTIYPEWNIMLDKFERGYADYSSVVDSTDPQVIADEIMRVLADSENQQAMMRDQEIGRDGLVMLEQIARYLSQLVDTPPMLMPVTQ